MKCVGGKLIKDVNLQGLIKAVMELFPDSEHRFCVRHLYSNMNQLHKGEVVKNHLWTCARASSPARWEECMEAFKTECPAAHAWLEEMPPNTWARAFFSEFSKCDLLLNNTCEVFNK
jgi:transposase-like protein